MRRRRRKQNDEKETQRAIQKDVASILGNKMMRPRNKLMAYMADKHNGPIHFNANLMALRNSEPDAHLSHTVLHRGFNFRQRSELATSDSLVSIRAPLDESGIRGSLDYSSNGTGTRTPDSSKETNSRTCYADAIREDPLHYNVFAGNIYATLSLPTNTQRPASPSAAINKREAIVSTPAQTERLRTAIRQTPSMDKVFKMGDTLQSMQSAQALFLFPSNVSELMRYTSVYRGISKHQKAARKFIPCALKEEIIVSGSRHLDSLSRCKGGSTTDSLMSELTTETKTANASIQQRFRKLRSSLSNQMVNCFTECKSFKKEVHLASELDKKLAAMDAPSVNINAGIYEGNTELPNVTDDFEDFFCAGSEEEGKSDGESVSSKKARHKHSNRDSMSFNRTTRTEGKNRITLSTAEIAQLAQQLNGRSDPNSASSKPSLDINRLTTEAKRSILEWDADEEIVLLRTATDRWTIAPTELTDEELLKRFGDDVKYLKEHLHSWIANEQTSGNSATSTKRETLSLDDTQFSATRIIRNAQINAVRAVINFKGKISVSSSKLLDMCDNFVEMAPLDTLFPLSNPDSTSKPFPGRVRRGRRASQYSLEGMPDRINSLEADKFELLLKSDTSQKLITILMKGAYWRILRKHVDAALPHNFADGEKDQSTITTLFEEAYHLYKKLDRKFIRWKKAGTRMRALYLLFLKIVLEADLRATFPEWSLFERAVERYWNRFDTSLELEDWVNSHERIVPYRLTTLCALSCLPLLHREQLRTELKMPYAVPRVVPLYQQLDSFVAALFDPSRLHNCIAPLMNSAEASRVRTAFERFNTRMERQQLSTNTRRTQTIELAELTGNFSCYLSSDPAFIDGALSAAADLAAKVVAQEVDGKRYKQCNPNEGLEISVPNVLESLEEMGSQEYCMIEHPNSRSVTPVSTASKNKKMSRQAGELQETRVRLGDMISLFCFVSTACPAFSAIPLLPYLSRLKDHFHVTSSQTLKQVRHYSHQSRKLTGLSYLSSVVEEHAQMDKDYAKEYTETDSEVSQDTSRTADTVETRTASAKSIDRFINSLGNRSITLQSPFLTEYE